MAHYVIGDIQGCYDELQALLQQIGFNHGTDTLWLVGDIINRGPKSLESLQFCMQHESSVRIVLGNHDLHLLALMYGYGRLKRSDTLQSILQHPDRQTMRDWLRSQSLLIDNGQYLMVHAGILPQWSTRQASALACEVEAELKSPRADAFFAHMYGNSPTAWSEDLSGYDRLRFITNVFTRMRALTRHAELDYDYKGSLADMPPELCAWFDMPAPRYTDRTIVFGHWSTLGYTDNGQVISLDTGALWGGKLTALNLANRLILQIDALHGISWEQSAS